MFKGVVIIQPKDWTPDEGPEGLQETLYDTYAEAIEAYNTANKDANIVTLFQTNENWYNRIQRLVPEPI